MRAFVQCSLALVSFAAVLSGQAIQPPEEATKSPEGIDEITVRGGKSLTEYRLELQLARDEMFRLFNELNEGKDNDVQCRNEAPTGSRIPQSVCRSYAEDQADEAGARQFLSALVLSAGAPGAGPQVNAEIGVGGAMGDAVRAGSRALAEFEEEWIRVLGGSRQVYEAAVEYVKLKEEYERLTGATSASDGGPRQIPLGPTGPQCEASTLTEFQQLNDVARVSGTVSVSMCPAGTTGSFTLVAQVRNDAGAMTPIEFSETWQRADAQDHLFNSDYPIGEDVVLVSVRVRNLTCTCEDSAP
jgi:hypothetical protein